MTDKFKLIERQEDLVKLLEDADITYSMYKNAVEKYTAVVDLLSSNGIDSHIYPQGSFAIGTVVKPLRRNKDADYDLDVICEVSCSKAETTAPQLYKKIKDALESSGRYDKKLHFFEECIRIEYADVGGYKFSMDIVPSVPEEIREILKMKSFTQRPDLCDTAIAITELDNDSLGWGKSNPKGYEKWFSEINERFHNYDFGVNTNRQQIFQNNLNVFSSADEIPLQIVRTPLQRVVQLLKLHKASYFSNPNVKDFSVKSVIIATLAAHSAQKAPAHYNTFELLDFVLKDLQKYSTLKDNPTLFKALNPDKGIIEFDGTEWKIENPSNPMDNLANSWNEDNEYVKYFFMWVNSAIKDFDTIIGDQDLVYGSVLSKMFGEGKVKDFGYDRKYKLVSPKPIESHVQHKPWLDYENA